MSSYEADHVFLQGPTFFNFKGADAPVVLPADGVLKIQLGEAAAIVLADGSVLKGICLLEHDGVTPFMLDPLNPKERRWASMLMLMAEDGGTITVVHDSADVADLNSRISVEDGASTAIDAKTVQVFWRMINATDRRWRVHDWAGV